MSLTLKIRVAGNTKTLQLSGDLSVHEVCKKIRESFEGAGGADHGLFFPEQGKWLVPTKVLDFYDLKSGDLLEFKKKHRPLKFKTLDGSVKTALVDETLPVYQLVITVCQRIGLQNPDEYSFQPELKTEDTKIEKDKSVRKGKNPLAEQIADDARWLNPEKTLAEQGLTETDVIILKKKFFFTDQNIDRNDPVQLNLLYNQAREAIISGKHPCTAEEASQFAAIQCQVQFGNHEPDKHKPGFIKVKDYVPTEYHKHKDIDKKIFHEHRKLQGLNALNAQFRYVQLSRSLKTYGITFFLVKERVVKKNKYIPVLLGVTKSSIVKLDMETKEITKQWPLTQLRRWAASPNSFTLDFGDYADAYYSVQSTEGDQISQLIAGYIDLILKKRKEAEKVIPEEEIEEASVEEYIQPGKPTKQVGLVSNGYRVAAETRIEPAQAIASNAMRSVNESIKQMPEFAAVLSKPPEYLPHQQTLLASIRSGLTMLKVCSADLNVATQLPPLGDDPASLAWKQQTIDVNASNIVAIIASLLAAAGSLINHATGIPDEMEFDLLTANVTSMTANVAQMGQGIKLLAALSNDGDGLLDAAHSLVESIVRLFDPLQSIAIGELERKNEFYTSGQELSVAAHGLLVKMDRLEVGEDAQHDLLALAYNVSKAVTDLVAGARNISKSLTDNHALQQDIVGDARYLFDTCQQLVACISTVAPTLNNQACADQVMEGSVYLRDAIGMLTSSCENSSDEELRDSLLDAASRVEESIAKLVEKTAQAGFVSVQEGTEIDLLHDLVLAAVERMIASANDVEAIIGNTKDLTLSASQFVTFLKQNASSIEDGDEKSRAISNAKNLADATSKMVACAKDAAKNPGDSEKQERLRSAVEEVQRTANVAAGSHVRNRVLFKLAQAVKDAIASSNQLISAAKAAAPSNRHQSSQLQLNQAARKVNEILPQLTAAVQAYQKNPDDLICRVKLVNLSKQMVLPGFAFVSISKLSSPTIGDSICQSQLLNTARQSEEDIRALERSQKIAEQINSELQVDSALRSIKNIQKDLMAAQEIGFDTNSETSPLELFSVASSIQQTISQLASAAAQQNERNTDFAATDAVMALQALSMAAQGFAAVESDIDFKQQILGAASGVADTLSSLISAAKTVASGSSTHEANETNLKSLVEGAAHALDTIVEFLPGQKDLEVAINSVEKTLSVLPSMKVKAVAASDPKEAEAKLMESAAKVTAAAHAVVQATRGTLSDLQTSLSAFTTAFETVTEASVIFDTTSSIKSNDVHSTSSILKELGESSAVLLNAAKAGFAEKDNQKIRQQLAESTRKFTKTTTKIIDVCSSASPQQIQINRALRTISEVGTRINEVAETGAQSGPVSEISASALRLQQVDNYGDCVQEIATNSKSIMNALVAINNLAKSGKTEEMAEKVNEVALTVSELTEANSRAAYLVGVANLNSTPATRDTVDRVTLIKGAEVIKSSCNALINIENDHNQILEIAASIAKTTSDICNACKVAGQTASILPQHRQTFIASAKETAARTTALVSTIKELATQTTEEAKEQCAVEVSKLINCVDGLVQFSDSPEFVGNAAVISAEGLDAQKPLIDYNKELLAAVENVTMAAKQLVSEPQDENFFGQLSSSIRSVTDSVQKLAKTVSSSTPGVKECEEVVAKVSEAVLVVDQAMVESSLNALEPKADASATAVVKSFQALSSLIEVTYQVTKNEPTQVVLSLQELPENFDQAIVSTIAVASQLPDVSAQQSILAEAKSAAEFMAEYMKSMKNAVANSKNHVVQEKFEENKGKLKNTFSKLINILEGATGEVIEFAESSEKIEYALSSIEPTVSLGALPTERISYQVVKTQIDDLGKKLVENVSDVISKAKSADQLRQYAVKIGDICESLKSAVCHASGVVEDHKVSDSLITSSRELMATSIKLVEAMRIASTKTAADLSARSKLTQAARDVSLNVSGLITIAKEGARGITVCQEAMWSINDYISDLDSVAIFAEAGQLDPMDQKDNFRNYKDSILTSAKSLTENIKGFITTVTGTQEELAHLVTTTVASLVVLKNETKKGASSITSADKNMQIQLLSATKNVCESLQGLISAAIGASGRSPSDPAMGEFGNAIKIQFGSMAELVRLIKLLADESSRGARALEGAIEEIDASLQEIQSEAPAHGTALPEEVVLIAKQLASGVASLVSASYGKEEDLVATSSVIKNKISELVRSGKATVENAPREQQLIMTASIARACKSTQEILETLRESSNSSQSLNQNDNFRDRVQHIAAEIANAITTVVGTANSLVEEGYVDQNDPDVKAERELLQAASSIEEAAKTLTVLRFEDSQAKEASIVPLTESQKFEGQIVEAAQSITTAMGSVIKAATAVQRENVTKGKISSSTAKTAYFSDGTWNEGLISGARLVANAIKDLTEAANEAVKGNVERERVIIAAKAVSASTAQLISASVAQSDVYSQTQVRLKAAGQSIKNAANQLVKATEESIAFEEPVAVDEGASVPEGKKTTAARVQEMEAQMSILKMEKELEKARMKLAAVRKGKYDSNLAEKAASADNRKSMKRQSSIMMSKNRTS